MSTEQKFKTIKIADQGKAVERPQQKSDTPKNVEIDGRKEGLEPTRYGDWEFKGKCVDF